MEKIDFSLPLDDLEAIANRASTDLRSMSHASLLITGGTDFFGKWLLEALLYARERCGINICLTVLSRAPERFLASMPHLRNCEGLNFIEGDITTANLDVVGFTHGIHGANLPFDHKPDWPVRHIETAMQGASNLISAAARNGCRTALFISSGAAYQAEGLLGKGESFPYKELQNNFNENMTESCVYGLTKRFTEVYITSLGNINGIKTPIARPFALGGPYMDMTGTQALGNFMADALAGRGIIIKGTGRAIRSYMYAADLVIWLLAILARGRHGVPYNVGSREAVTISDVADAVKNAFAPRKISVKVLNQSAPGCAPEHYVPDTTRCEEELGLSCTENLKTICEKTAKWLDNNKGN